MSTTEGTWRTAPLGRWRSSAALLWATLGSVGLALVLAAFLLMRRLAGALTEPLPPAPLVVTAVVMLAWAWAVRFAWSQRNADESIASPNAKWLVSVWAPSLVVLMLAVACSFPGGRLIDWLVWVLTIFTYWFGPHVAVVRARRSSPTIVDSEAAALSHDNRQVLQQMTRYRAAEGADVIHGTLVAEFVPGERTVTLHAAFCPPFERLPDVEANVADAAIASVKVSQVLHNGVRLDVRLARPADAMRTIAVELVATETTK